MCAHAEVPKSLWADAASTPCYVYNRLPNAPLKCKSPHEVWYSRKPDHSNLRVFGCVANALVAAAKRKKFDNRTEKMRFLGYHKGHRGYKLMEKGSNPVFYRTDVTFDESNFRLTEDKPAERKDEAPTVEVEVGSSGSHASQPVKVPVKNQPGREKTLKWWLHHERGSQSLWLNIRGPFVTESKLYVTEQLNCAEEVIASALCAAELDEPKMMNEA